LRIEKPLLVTGYSLFVEKYRSKDQGAGPPQEERSAFGLEERFAYRSREQEAGSEERGTRKQESKIRSQESGARFEVQEAKYSQ
jgi:hypothetical protein